MPSAPHCIPLLAAILVPAAAIYAETKTPTIIEAEDAALGSSLSTATASNVTFIEPTVNFTGMTPETEDTIATVNVTFPEAGEYELYARVYVGPDGANDDSMLVSTSLGNTSLDEAQSWSLANGLYNVGYSDPETLVLSSGATGSETWKWIRISSVSELTTLTVPDTELNQTYRFASREDGLRIDKLAFALVSVTFTVDQLDQGLPGLGQDDPGGEIFQTSGPVIAHHKTKFLGSVWSGTPAYNKDFEYYWNGMWHGNAGKWGTVEATRDVMNWTVVDEGYQFAKANGVKFNFHVLLWGSQQPSWIDTLPVAEKREEIEEWMQAVADRYPDIDYLQVVNEPINAPPDGTQSPWASSPTANYADALGGNGETGFDWIIESFRLARQYFPDTPLMINEYNVEGSHERSNKYLEIIEALKAEGLIDLVGFQGHAFSTQGSSAEDMRTILDKIASTGLPIMITEMEIDGFNDFVQLEEYKRVFPIYWDHPSVIGINLSGHIGNWRADQGAVLVNENFSERPALKWIREYVEASPWNNFDGFLETRNLDREQHSVTADLDKDGLATGLEYLLDFDPETYDTHALAFRLTDRQLEISLPVSYYVLDGIVRIESSPDMDSWKRIASYDLNLRAGDSCELVEGEDGRTLLFYEILSETNDQFLRITFDPND